MWASVVFLLAVGYASAEYGWKAGTQYKYEVTSKTLTGLHQVADQYSGVFLKAKLTVQPTSDNQITLQVDHARYADVHRNFSQATTFEVPEHELNYQELPISMKTFQIYLKKGVIEKMVVDKNIPQWQLNLFKSIASQLQVDTQGQNLKKSKSNLVPQENEDFGSYKTMEDSINGKYETKYDISRLPESAVQSRPEVVPLPHLKGDGHYIEVVKTRNFSNAQQHMIYRFGASGREGWKAGSNLMGNFLSRSSVSRIVLSGSLKQYTIQSSVTEEKVQVAPHLHNGQKGTVYAQMNVTIQHVSNSQESLQSINQPKSIKNLVYGYSEGFQGRQAASLEESDSASHSSSSSDSSSSSSEENQNDLKGNKLSKGNYKYPKGDSLDSQRTKMSKDKSNQESREDKSSSSSSSSSETSSEEYLPEEPEMQQAPKIEFLPNFYGYEQHQVVENIKQGATHVAKWIHNPGQIPEEQYLAYFALLTQLVANATSQQLQEATAILYYPVDKAEQQDDQQESEKYEAWLVFRDAVAEAGTGPALVTIKEWINTKKIKEEEAAQVVAALPYSARYPTTEYMDYFFEIMKSREVQRQRYLNTSAIIAFSELVRKSQVEEDISQNRYTIHLFKGKSQHHGRVVRENYIPYLQSQLKRAISQEDSIKIQVYIRAIGNTAHPQIMAVFEPYLEGKNPVTNFQRLSMIAALDEMTRAHPNLARSVLYRIYQNQGDLPEIRVAAVMQIMKTNPPAQMLQRMAEFTNYDTSKQVNAAVKSAIESAATSQEYEESELTLKARSAANLLTTETYGGEYSKNFLRSYIVKEQEQLQYQSQISYIQGQDSVYPKYAMYEVFRTIGGYKREPYSASYILSSADQLWEMLNEQFAVKQQKSKDQNQQQERSSYSFEKINNLLNLQSEQQEQLEGAFLVNLFGAKRFFTFDNHTIEQLPKLISEYNQKLQKGQNFQFSKYYNQYTMEIGFPISTGHQFTYSLDVPTLVAFRGQLKGQVEKKGEGQHNQGMHVGVNGDFQFTYSAQKRGKMGFVSKFNDQRYIAGVDKNILLHLPIQGKVEFIPTENTLQAQIQPFSQGSENQKLFQFSSNVYTTIHRNKVIKPYQKGENVQYVYAKPLKHYHKTIGNEASGYAFDINMRSEQNLMDMTTLYKKVRSHDLLSYITFHDMEETIENSQLTIGYNPQMSSSQPLSIGFSYISGDEQKSAKFIDRIRKFFRGSKASEDGNSLAQPQSYETRREELLRNVRSNIQDPQASVVDAYVQFGSEAGKNSYSMTIAHAKSHVAEESRLLAYIQGSPVKSSEETKSFQASFQFKIKEPKLPIFNYEEALKSEPKTTLEGEIILTSGTQSNGKISVKGDMQRSDKRKEHLQQHPLSATCQQQMSEGNYIQPVCRNATLNAYYLDQYKFVVSYEDLPTWTTDWLYKAYSLARHARFQNHEENAVNVKNAEGQLAFGVQFERDLQGVNVSIDAPRMSAAFTNVKLNQWAIPLTVYNAKHNQITLLSQKLFNHQPIFTAVLDGNQVTTFNNQSYTIQLGNCYHVFSMYAPPTGNEQEHTKNSQQNFAVLVKESSNQQKDAQIILGDDEISLTSSSGKPSIIINGQEVQVTQSKMAHWSNEKNSLEAHSHSDNTVVIYLPSSGIKVIYDTNRVQLSLSNSYRNKVRGLAGSFDGEQNEDFTLPNNRIQRSQKHFTSSYALADPTCQGPAKQRHNEAKNFQGYEKKTIFGNVVSDREAGRSWRQEAGKRNYASSSQDKNRKQQGCTVYAVKIIEDKGRTCFSSRPHVTCSSQCKPSKMMQKSVEFQCYERSSTTRQYVEMIKKGATPDFSQSSSLSQTQKFTINLPERCVPN